LKPDTFLTPFTLQSFINTRSINALLALAVMIPLAANQFDLSTASVLGLAQVLAIGLQVNQGVGWPAACIICLVVGAVVGLANGVLVVRFGVNSFIATLGSGTLLLGLSQWYTGRYLAAGGLPQHVNLPPRFQYRFTSASSRKPQNSETLVWADIGRIRAAWPRTLIVR
jgi:ribose transport system permease protein